MTSALSHSRSNCAVNSPLPTCTPPALLLSSFPEIQADFVVLPRAQAIISGRWNTALGQSCGITEPGPNPTLTLAVTLTLTLTLTLILTLTLTLTLTLALTQP